MISPVTITAGRMISVAASQTGATLGSAGKIGDYVSHVPIKPTTTSPGAVTLIDGVTSYVLFVGGATSVVDIATREVNVRVCSLTGAWTITTGSNVAVIVVGEFS